MSRKSRLCLMMILCSSALSFATQAEDWRTAAKKLNLTPGQIERLSQDKMLVVDGRHWRQVFSPYVNPDMPVFITSDSILNAYHVLLEESVLQIEQANAQRLPEIVRFVWKNLESAGKRFHGKPELVAKARRRAQIVLGTALGVLGIAVQADAETLALIRQEVGRVEAATGQFKPAWLGSRDDPSPTAIDYSRYKLRGFYDQSDELSRYFRATAWLQSIPFRASDDEQLLAILMLGDGLTEQRFSGDAAKRKRYCSFFEYFRGFFGDRDDWDLPIGAAAVQSESTIDFDTGGLEKIKRSLCAKAGHAEGHINDQVAYGPAGPEFRVLSAYRLPDAVLFQQTTDPPLFRPLPTGLEVCVALGSAYAARSFDDPEREKVLRTIANSRSLFSGHNLYCEYLRCLATLFDAPAAGAPVFMSSEAWQAKSCTTALAGWAQLRHTWMLQAKETIVWSSLEDELHPVGFVEPNPTFFHQFTAIVKHTGALLAPEGTLSEVKLSAIVQLQNALRHVQQRVASGEGINSYQSIKDLFALNVISRIVRPKEDKMNAKQAKDFVAAATPVVNRTIEDIRHGRVDAAFYCRAPRWKLDRLWSDLADLSARLESLSGKQLSGVPLTLEESQFIRSYGELLAPIMFHAGDPSETPRDDAPRIADVAYNPQTGECLEVGVGRPQILYVLHPTKNGEVLCRGAVMPYYEFCSKTRLDDSQWLTQLDQRDAPKPRTWIPAK